MTTWSYDWFPLPGQAVFDKDHQDVAAVTRAPGNLDLFVIGNDAHIWSTWWNDQAGWSQDWFPLPGQAVFDKDHQKVAAVSRAPGNLDLFVIGNDAHIWSTWWNDQAGWAPDWFPLPGQAVFDKDHQKLAAVSRAPGNLDLFVVGNDAHVWSTWWNDQAGWSQDWFPLPGQAVFDRNVQQVAAVSRAPGNLDLFIVGNDDHVWSTWWNDQAGWAPGLVPAPRPGRLRSQRPAGCRRITRARQPRPVHRRQRRPRLVDLVERPSRLGSRTGSRSPARPSSIATSSRLPPYHARPATSTCSSSATTPTSGRPGGTTKPAGPRTGSRCPARRCSTATRSWSPRSRA